MSVSPYNKQITNFANADERLIEALRRMRSRDYVYGFDTGQAPLLQSYCEDIGLPKPWGDPAQTIPIPCEVQY
jgi:protein-disulfide isomerase-like protein with CxxC motif